MRHAFEFGDLAVLPESWHNLLHRVLRFSMSKPFRDYYDHVAELAANTAKENQLSTLVELGAGDAPLARRWLSDSSISSIVIADKHLHLDEVEYLERDHPDRLQIIRESIDFTQKNAWAEDSLLVISASFHHIPKGQREQVLTLYKQENLLICEPLSYNIRSFLFGLLTFVPALLYPLSSQKPMQRLESILWCWLIPVIPLMLTWDAIISTYRQWSQSKWLKILDEQESENEAYRTNGIVQSILFIQNRKVRSKEKSTEPPKLVI